MKKALFLLISCLYLFSCPENGEIQYTNVEYNGNTVTLHLQGGVPVNKSYSRALTKQIAQVSHDYYEVAFSQDGVKVVSAFWQLGNSAVIRDVPNGNYNDASKAILFVGRKGAGSNTLLAVGLLTAVDGKDGETELTALSKTVSFTVAALSGGMHVMDGVTVNDADSNPVPVITDDEPIGNRIYKRFHLDNSVLGSEYKLTYKIDTDTPSSLISNYTAGIANVGVAPNVDIKTPPAFLNGEIDDLKCGSPIDTTALLANNYDPDINEKFDPEIEINITVGTGSGVFYVTFSIPVKPINRIAEGNNWYIQPGMGSYNNYIDSGEQGFAGAILFSTGNDPDDYRDLNK